MTLFLATPPYLCFPSQNQEYYKSICKLNHCLVTRLLILVYKENLILRDIPILLSGDSLPVGVTLTCHGCFNIASVCLSRLKILTFLIKEILDRTMDYQIRKNFDHVF